MNRLQARNLVVQNTCRTDKTDLINSALDLAVAEVSAQALWIDLLTPGSVTLLSAATSVALATEVDRVSEVRLINGLSSYPLQIRPKTWVVQRYPNIAILGASQPTVGYIEGKTLYVAPPSNAQYEVRYTYCRLHPALATDLDEILIRHGAPAVIAWATSWVFQAIEKHDDAKSWDARYQMQLRSAIKANGNSAVNYQFSTSQGIMPVDYWLNPFVRSMP